MALRSFLNGAVFAEVFGDGVPEVLALHGWGRRGADFAHVLQGRSALAPDLPGFGASPPPDHVMGAESYAEAISGLLDVFDRPPVVVGHSFGGRLAVCLAARRPEKVGPLVLTGVPLIRRPVGSGPSAGFRVARWMNRVGMLSDERMERLRRSRGSADYRAATGVMRDILVTVVNESYEGQLSRIGQPVEMVWGAEDTVTPVSIAEAAQALLREASLEVLPGVGHLVPTQAPGALAEAIDRVAG